MKYHYVVNYGQVPFKQKLFTAYSDAAKFIKEQVDAGFIVRSVHKELVEVVDYIDSRDSLVKSVDIIGDR